MTSSSHQLVPLIDRLARFFFLAKQYNSALHDDLNLSTGERAILLQLSRDGYSSVPRLAQERGISRQAIQKTVDMLVARKLLEKIPSPTDKRNRQLILSAQGQDFLTKLQVIELAEAETFSTAFSNKEIAAFEAMLDRIETAISTRMAYLRSKPESKR